MTVDGVIGLDGTIPWHYSADLKRFKRLTLGSTVIMGRKTWESLPNRPLPERQNIVVTRTSRPKTDHCASLEQAIRSAQHDNIWFIGGAELYREAIDYCDSIDVTHVPDTIDHKNSIRFPAIDWTHWCAQPKLQNDEDQRLYHQLYVFSEIDSERNENQHK